MTLSAVAGDRHIHRRGDWDVRPNIWILLLGNSSSYKSTGLAAARRLLFLAAPNVLAAQEYSHEKLIQDISENPHRLFIYDEAESFFRLLDQNNNGSMKATLMTLWNRHPYRREIRGKDGNGEISVIDNAYLCWGGASTSVQIANQMKNGSSDLLSGFLPRFTIVSYFGKERIIEDPPPADLTKREALVSRLKYLAFSPDRFYTYTNEAIEAKRAWLSDFEKRSQGADFLLGSFYKKLRDEQFHKLCLISAFERESSEMTIDDVAEAASMLWQVEKGWPDVLSKLSEKEWDRDISRVENFIKSEHKVDRKEILRAIRGVKAQKLTAILDGLTQDGKIDISKEDNHITKPKTIITWVE